MYRVKLKGNFNVCVNDLDAIFTYNRPEKTFSDSEFENSEDIQRYIGKYLVAEHVDVKQPKPSKEVKENPTNKVDTKIETTDDKDRIIIQNKEHKQDSDIVVADNASFTVKPEDVVKDEDIVVADGTSSEENVITPEDKKSVRVDNFGNTVQDVESNAVVEESKKEVKNEKMSKKSAKKKVTTKIALNDKSNENNGVEKSNE